MVTIDVSQTPYKSPPIWFGNFTLYHSNNWWKNENIYDIPYQSYLNDVLKGIAFYDYPNQKMLFHSEEDLINFILKWS